MCESRSHSAEVSVTEGKAIGGRGGGGGTVGGGGAGGNVIAREEVHEEARY